jgi:PhnB protein
MDQNIRTSFAPMLLIEDGIKAIEFYKKALGAVELRRFSNSDGSIHVAELAIDDVIFHIRQIRPEIGHFNPLAIGGITSIIELWVNDPAAIASLAVEAGAKLLSPVKNYAETGYQQGTIKDPFGHSWHIMRPLNL